MKKRFCVFCFLLIFLFNDVLALPNENAYLFVYFTGNDKSQEAIHYAISFDGFNYFALNNHKPVIDSDKISLTGGVRDPHIIRVRRNLGIANPTKVTDADGEIGIANLSGATNGNGYFMVVTDMVSGNGWDSNRGMVLMKSENLVDWESTAINLQEIYPDYKDLKRVWAPQTIYDYEKGLYMIYWSMKFGDGPDVIYYAYVSQDFSELIGKPSPLFIPKSGMSCIDGDMVFKDGEYHLFYKTEGSGNGIKKAVTNSLSFRNWIEFDDYLQPTDKAVEGSFVFKLTGSDKYIMMYDAYMDGRFQFTESDDLVDFKVIDNQIKMDFKPRHGSIVSITLDEAELLVNKWGTEDTHKLLDLKKNECNNPILKGYYADPEILYSHKTNRFYLYPTTDGFDGWGGDYFKVFSSDDLVSWKDEGIILDLKTDVEWAKRNAWAPCIEEKIIDGEYKYFFYFTAQQKIGVAWSDSPTGPFTDSGSALIDFKPEGINYGQEIDPDVFTDPVTMKSYIYWGNGYLAVARLGNDMLSIDKNSVKVITPTDNTFREGVYVICREGRYYFFWSEDDTRSENYRVRYGYADNPLGPIIIPEQNLVLAKDAKNGIYGTGHNSIIQIPGRDEWYIVYHRFKYPNGIKMGDKAGFHRETCIDKITFDTEGKVVRVVPTHKGVKAVVL